MNEWKIQACGFDKSRIAADGNRFLLGNGSIGYRGTPDEFTREHMPALNIASFYDGVPGKWRETVNAPNPFYAELFADGRRLKIEDCRSVYTELDIGCGIWKSDAVHSVGAGVLRAATERFVSMERADSLFSRTEFLSDVDVRVEYICGIDADVWDINGPHLESFCDLSSSDRLLITCRSQEKKIPLSVSVGFDRPPKEVFRRGNSAFARFVFDIKAGEKTSVARFACIRYGFDSDASEPAAASYGALREEQRESWSRLWKIHDVELHGDERAQKALRYSIYQLLILRPRRAGSIAARGLSGQTYKGAVFWDTEIFILPFFLSNDPEAASKLVRYRVDTLPQAKEKAASYGFGGAFYAWESQQGYDACSDFNVTDVFTHRPVRTYFKDKQIHISGDVVYALDEYVKATGDTDLIVNGGLETALECALFYYEYSYYNHVKNRFELLDVMGPDEYHERVNNNAFTNYLARNTVRTALKFYEIVRAIKPKEAERTARRVGDDILVRLSSWADLLYLPQPSEEGIIEQFDGYFRHEDVTPETLRTRLTAPNEYWGGSTGVATATRVIKQADVVALLSMFDLFDAETSRANYDFYLPYTEHGSSLSACMYALTACRTGRPDDAWEWFMKTAEVDLEGGSKQWAGEVYIGGTHPAANGGAYLTAVRGFAGMSRSEDGTLSFTPRLPKNIDKIVFHALERGVRKKITVTREKTEVIDEI